jgi:hypothetical protein
VTSGGPVAGTTTTTYSQVSGNKIKKEIRRICLFGVGRRTVVPKKYYAVKNCRLALEISVLLVCKPLHIYN